jgi:hypothetical protein
MNIKNRPQLLGILAAAAVVLFAANKLLFNPLTRSWDDRAKSIATLRAKVEEGRSLRLREPSLRGRWDQIRTNTLPRDPSLAQQRLLNAFDGWAEESRVGLNSITPQWKQEADDYATVECRVEAAGDLGAVSRFLYNIEKDPLALKLQAIELNARDNTGQQFSLGLQVSALVLTPPEKR